MRVGKWTRQVGAAFLFERLVRRFFLHRHSVLTGFFPVTLVVLSALPARAGRASGLVVGALHLILEPVPNVSAGKGDSLSRPTYFFLDKGRRLVSFSPVSP